ncbi:MAG TPA: hypothetical protein VJ570_09280 [Holophagaceae bacterium]|nr:hypothetical protein [Holophagaceae bacterium]
MISRNFRNFHQYFRSLRRRRIALTLSIKADQPQGLPRLDPCEGRGLEGDGLSATRVHTTSTPQTTFTIVRVSN